MHWVITGANRGIGLELVRQLAARGEQIEAGARDPKGSASLVALAKASEGRVRVHPCDVVDDASVTSFAKAVGDTPVDVLVNNAGVYGSRDDFDDLDLDDALRTFQVNALGALRVTRAFLPRVLASNTRRVVQITSGMGSITDNDGGGAYGYRMSKAALNMANKSLSVDFRSRGIVAVVMNPGWVKTDMGGAGAPVAVEESARLIIGRIDGLTKADNGTFLNYKGGTYPY